MSIIDDIRRDMEDGTPGRWTPCLYDTDGKQFDRGSVRVMRGNYFGRAVQSRKAMSVVALVPHCHADNDFDARRIARVPQLEQIALAAEAMAEALQHLSGVYDCSDVTAPALSAYWKAMEAAE